ARYFCGVEGGSTSTEVAIISDDGKQCSKVVGPHVNQWTLGLEKAVERTVFLIESALKKANLPINTLLLAVGLALSGIDSEENARDFENGLRKVRPALAEQLYACNDCYGTLFAVTEKGGIVLIAGTGSNCKLIRENLSAYGVGGHGHMLGDEGSAFWIAHRVIKTYLDDDEGLVLTSFDTSAAKKAIFDYFGLRHNVDLLEPHYHFEKNYYSGLCQKIAELARAGDALCRHVFYEAGFFLGAHVMAVLQKADLSWRMNSEGVNIVCRGGVFNSWDLLEAGFRDRVTPDIETKKIVHSIRLVFITSSVAVGAALLAAHVKFHLDLPRNHSYQLLAEFRA
uniref:N-acetyl-D-glucosamine kinase n=2 Tax=Mesocestoides corti TaxID=53468 RepID=A0A5K3FLR5_MESCO